MFGFLNGNTLGHSYRQVYARGCQSLWVRHGRLASLFHSYEAVFLRCLSIDLGDFERPRCDAPVCCRLWRKQAEPLSLVDDFSNAFAMLLAEVKLRDDVADDRSHAARLMLRWLRRPIERSHLFFCSIDSQFESKLTQILGSHRQLEARAGRPSLLEFQKSTSDGFAYLFELFARMTARKDPTGRKSNDKCLQTMAAIGAHVGAALISFDCAVDWPRDRDKGQVNPVASSEQASQALLDAQRHLSQAGWLGVDLAGAEALSAQILRAKLQQLGRRRMRLNREATLVRPSPRTRRNALGLRKGICDGCDCGGCDCGSCDCNGCDGEPGNCNLCCAEICCAPFDLWNSGRKAKNQNVAPKSEGNATHTIESGVSAFVGLKGKTVGPLKPSGIVRVQDEEYPAVAQLGFIEGDASVQVVQQNSYGLVVVEVPD